MSAESYRVTCRDSPLLRSSALAPDCMFLNKSVISVRTRAGEMRIIVKKSLGRTFSVHVDARDTVLTVKERIQQQHSIPIEHQLLISIGPPLINAHILKDVGIKDNSVLNLLDRCFYQIVVSINECHHFFLLAEASDIAEDLTKRIEKMVGVPAPQQLLVFNSHILDTLAERRQLSQLGFRPGSKLQVFTVCPAREWVPAFPA